MIIFLAIFFILIILMEFLIFKQKAKYQKLFLQVNRLNNILDIFKTLSYVPTSKRILLRDDIADVISAFFVQSKFTSLSLIINQSKQVWRYFKNTEGLNQGISQVKDPSPNVLEKSLLSHGQGGMVIPLKNNFSDYGYLLLFSQSNEPLDESEVNLLDVLGGVLTMTLSKWDLNSRLLLDAQIKAVSVLW